MTATRSLFQRRWLVVLLAGALALSACRKNESEGPVAPDVVGDESDAELRTKHHADDAFTLAQSDGSYRVLSFKLPKASAPDSDYRLVAYRRQGNTYVRHGAEQNLVDFERPRLSSGSPPRIETSLNRLGVRYHFALDAKRFELVPSEGMRDDGSLVGHPQTHTQRGAGPRNPTSVH